MDRIFICIGISSFAISIILQCVLDVPAIILGFTSFIYTFSFSTYYSRWKLKKQLFHVKRLHILERNSNFAYKESIEVIIVRESYYFQYAPSIENYCILNKLKYKKICSD